MIDRSDSARKKWFIAGAVLLPLAVVLIWAMFRTSRRDPDDPRELLLRASATTGAADAKPTGKSIAVEGTSSSGTPVHARFVEVQEGSGRKGYGLHLAEPLKEGESTALKMPGGGTVTVARPREGEAPELVPATKQTTPDQKP